MMEIYDIVKETKISEEDFKKMSYHGWRALKILNCKFTESRYVDISRLEELVTKIIDNNGSIYNVVAASSMRHYFPDLKKIHGFSSILEYRCSSTNFNGLNFSLLIPDKKRVDDFLKKHRPEKSILKERYSKYLKNPDVKKRRTEEKRRWNENNSEKVKSYNREYSKKRRSTDLNFKIRGSLRNRLKLAIKKEFKKSSCVELLGCSIEHFKKYMESKFSESMTWENYGEWHIDHIKPCCLFDLSSQEAQRICFNYKNLQPLWAKDNILKGRSYTESEG